MSAPTDARPFFFNQLRLDRLFDQDVFALASRPGVYGGNLSATLTLAILIVISAVFVAATIIVPLRSTVSTTEPALAAAGTAYFALIGIGFMMAEIALLQRISVFLGHPVYALSVVLFSLILSTGIGSLASERIPLDSRAKLIGWSALVGLYLLALPVWLPDVLLRLESAGVLVRAGLAVLVLAPAGFLMGFGFPTGMRLVSSDRREADPVVLGHQRRGGCARRERCRADQHRVRNRHDASSRGGLLSAASRTGLASRPIRSTSATGGHPNHHRAFCIRTSRVSIPRQRLDTSLRRYHVIAKTGMRSPMPRRVSS